MKRTIRLTETQLKNVIKKAIREQYSEINEFGHNPDPISSSLDDQQIDKANMLLEKYFEVKDFNISGVYMGKRDIKTFKITEGYVYDLKPDTFSFHGNDIDNKYQITIDCSFDGYEVVLKDVYLNMYDTNDKHIKIDNSLYMACKPLIKFSEWILNKVGIELQG